MTTTELQRALDDLDASPVAAEWARRRVSEALDALQGAPGTHGNVDWPTALQRVRGALVGTGRRGSVGVFDPHAAMITRTARRTR